MVLNAGIITHRFQESKDFYTSVLGFGITFENDWLVLLHTPDRQNKIGFLRPDYPPQHWAYRPLWVGKGVYITLEVANAQAEYSKMQVKGVPIEIALKEELGGDPHFVVVDPNGIGVDIVTCRANAS